MKQGDRVMVWPESFTPVPLWSDGEEEFPELEFEARIEASQLLEVTVKPVVWLPWMDKCRNAASDPHECLTVPIESVEELL